MRLRYLHIPDLPPLKDVSITFGHEAVLGRECTIHFIAGINGAGKSRLLRAIAEIFLYLEQPDVPPFPVTIAYDLGRNLTGEETSQSISTIYYRYTGHGKASAYMVVLEHISLYTHVDWENFHLFDWKHDENEKLPYAKRRCLCDDTYGEVKSYLPQLVLAYTSGMPREWETVFTPLRRDIESNIDVRFPQVEKDAEERRQIERPPGWNSAKEKKASFKEPQEGTTTVQPLRELVGDVSQRKVQASIGIFILPETLKLVACAVALSRVLEEFSRYPSEREREAFVQEIARANQEGQHMEGMRDILNAIDWLWPITIGLRIAFQPERFLREDTTLLTQLYRAATQVLRESGPGNHRTLFFDLQRSLDVLEYERQSTLEVLTNILSGGLNSNDERGIRTTSAFAIFKQLFLLQQRGILEDVVIAVKKRNVDGVLLYDQLSDGERVFIGRMALFHLLKGFDDTLIILDEPETHFNDIWKREVVDIIDSGLRADSSEIVLSTHSSIALTDAFNSEITILKKDPQDASVYATRPKIRSFGASTDDILREIFGAPDSVGQRASEFLDMMLIVAAYPDAEQIQRIWSSQGDNLDTRTGEAIRLLREYVHSQPGAYVAAQNNTDLEDYLLKTLRAVYRYTRQYREHVSIVDALDVLQERLGPGFYQFEFRRRLRALRKDSDAAQNKPPYL